MITGFIRKNQAAAPKNRILNSDIKGVKEQFPIMQLLILPKFKRNAKVRNANKTEKTIFIPKMLM
jgi:hypothetical protein